MNNRVKPNILSDYLHSVNSLCLFLTETWLESNIEDAEVKIHGYNILRSDRIGRKRGGVALYIKNELAPKKEATFSNGVVEYLVVK